MRDAALDRSSTWSASWDMSDVEPVPPVRFVALSATGSGVRLPVTGRHVPTDGHSPSIVGQYPRQLTGDVVTVEIDGAPVPVDVVRYIMANGRPTNWAETLPAWDAGYQSDVRRGRNKRGPTAKVTRHGRWSVEIERDRYDIDPPVRLTAAQVARMASLWARTACEACRAIVEACEACDGSGEIQTGSTVKVCRACRSGCGCMPESDDETRQTQAVVSGGLATDLAAPRSAGPKRDAWLVESWERQAELSATCPVAVAHSELSDVLGAGFTGTLARDRRREAHAVLDTDRSSLRRSAVEHDTARQPSRFVIRRAARLAGAAKRRSAGVTVLGSDAHGRQILGRRHGLTSSLVGWGDIGQGYWIGHRFVPTARLIRQRRAAAAAVRTVARATVARSAESETDRFVTELFATLRGMPETGSVVVDCGAPVTVVRTAPGRWSVDGRSPVNLARTVAALSVRRNRTLATA